MKTILRAAAAVLTLLGGLPPAAAGAAGTRSPGEPLAGASIANTASLNFGRLSASAIAGNVTMSPLGCGWQPAASPCSIRARPAPPASR